MIDFFFFLNPGRLNNEEQAEVGAGESRRALKHTVFSLLVASSLRLGKKPGPFSQTGRNVLVLLSWWLGPVGHWRGHHPSAPRSSLCSDQESVSFRWLSSLLF